MDWTQLNQRIQATTLQLCQYPQGSRERVKTLNNLLRLISKPLKLLGRKCPYYYPITNGDRQEDPDYYEDALQKTLIFCSLNICQSDTNTGKAYNPDEGSVLNWLQTYLCYRLQDFRLKEYQEAKMREPILTDEEGNVINADLKSRSGTDSNWVEDIKAWIEADTDGELKSCHIRNYPEANCQVLLLKRLPFDTYQKWQEIAEELGLGIPTLNGHYQKKCLKLLLKYREQEGI